MRESRSLGSVGAKAEWLSYPTNPAVVVARIDSAPIVATAENLEVWPE